MISESGLTKIPEQMLKNVKDEINLLFLSDAYHLTRLDSSFSKYHNMILKLCQYYGINPLEKHLLTDKFVVKFSDNDLPKDYRKYQNRPVDSITIEISRKASKDFGQYNGDDTISIFPGLLYTILKSPGFDEHVLFEAFKNISGTIDHELTHFINTKYLHPDNSTMLPNYPNYNAYYNSNTEFQPTLKSDLIWLAEIAYKIKLNDQKRIDANDPSDSNWLKDHATALDPNQLNDVIRYWIGSKYTGSYDFEPSNFFKSLRERNHEKYLRAVKLFAGRAKDTIRDYIAEHDTVVNFVPKRLDTVFCNLRLNEFCNFVRLVNTFIAFPESRLHDYESIKTFLDKIDSKYKQQGADNLIFIPCGEKSIDYVVNKKKSFIIDSLFSNPDIEKNGMLFEFSEVPVLLNINILTHDDEFVRVCTEYSVKYQVGNFVIADGSKFKFSFRNLKGVYRNGVLQS